MSATRAFVKPLCETLFFAPCIPNDLAVVEIDALPAFAASFAGKSFSGRIDIFPSSENQTQEITKKSCHITSQIDFQRAFLL